MNARTQSTGSEGSNGITESDCKAVRDKLSGLVSYGMPTCDHCYDAAPEDRPERGEFWPDAMEICINANGETLADWKGETRCLYHAKRRNTPEGTTHIVRATHVHDDEHHMNSAERYVVRSVAKVD